MLLAVEGNEDGDHSVVLRFVPAIYLQNKNSYEDSLDKFKNWW